MPAVNENESSFIDSRHGVPNRRSLHEGCFRLKPTFGGLNLNGSFVPGPSKLAPRQQRGANGSDLGILGEGKSILNVNSEVADRILDLAMAEEDLDRAQVAGRPIDD